VVFDPDGNEISEGVLEDINDAWYATMSRIDDTLETHDSRSLADAIDAYGDGSMSDPGFNWAFSAYTEFSKGGPVEDLSATLYDDDDAFDTPDVVVVTGYDELLKPLAAGLDIRLSTPVSAIAYSDEGVSVTTSAGVIDADYAVCSVSLGILKAGTIAFDPPLPGGYRDSIEKVGFGSVTKIAFKFPEAFWDPDVQYFGAMTQPKGRWNYWVNYRTFSPENILLGLSVGAYAPVADKMTDEQASNDALDVLKNIWGADVGTPVQMLRTRWAVHPHTLGAYAYPRPGNSPSDYDGLGDPVEDRLILAGEHTIFDYAGTTHGAYMTGLRAAEHILDDAG
jgi:monoamine oxidase